MHLCREKRIIRDIVEHLERGVKDMLVVFVVEQATMMEVDQIVLKRGYLKDLVVPGVGSTVIIEGKRLRVKELIYDIDKANVMVMMEVL